MGDDLLTALSMENHHPSTLLSMDSSARDELHLDVLTSPPDINLSLSDIGLSTQIHGPETFLCLQKPVKKPGKRVDSVWGAWLFFSFYFKPVLNDKSRAKIIRSEKGISGFEKSDLQLDLFMVQHDMENMYMWAFKEKPENALGKMQLRSYMNGHSRQGENPFPFSPDKGFIRSHRMQRKHYRGLSNPQCVHGIEVVPSPNLSFLNESDRKRWMELTGRDLDFTIPPEASDYGHWRNSPTPEFDIPSSKNLVNDYVLLIDHHGTKKRKKDLPLVSNEDCYLKGFSGVMRAVYGPVTAAKTTYEDESGYLIMISLPFVDLHRVKVSWRNTVTNGIIKLSCTSTSRAPFIKRHNRMFKLTDVSSEHCPPGEFVREITLSSRIPENAKIDAWYDGLGTVLEILVPKLEEGLEEHEVRVRLRPSCDGGNDLMLN